MCEKRVGGDYAHTPRLPARLPAACLPALAACLPVTDLQVTIQSGPRKLGTSDEYGSMRIKGRGRGNMSEGKHKWTNS